jgi:hypothetical protein
LIFVLPIEATPIINFFFENYKKMKTSRPHPPSFRVYEPFLFCCLAGELRKFNVIFFLQVDLFILFCFTCLSFLGLTSYSFVSFSLSQHIFCYFLFLPVLENLSFCLCFICLSSLLCVCYLFFSVFMINASLSSFASFGTIYAIYSAKHL